MRNDIVVRPIAAADEPFVLGLARRFGEGELPRGLAPDVVEAGTRRYLATAIARLGETDHVVVAEAPDGALLGFLYAHEREDFFSGERYGHVSEVAVVEEAEGTGAATALLDEAARWSIARGYPRLGLNVFAGNARARRFYERLGFAPETLAYSKPLRGPER